MANKKLNIEKPKRRSLTLKQKVRVISLLKDSKFKKTTLAKEYGVDRSTIRKIELQQDKILKIASSGSCQRKYATSGKHSDLEQALFYWFLQARDRHEIVTTNLLLGKARAFAAQLDIAESLKFSSKWVRNFKKRYGLRKLKISGEKLSSDMKSVEPFKDEFFERIREKNLSADQLYNADESGLFYKMLHSHTLVHSAESAAPGRKVAKERVTFLPCANATGTHKLPMLMIGKSKNPRAFKNIHLPLEYDSSKNAWMTRTIFQKWFHGTFVPCVRRYSEENSIEPKAVLLLDNCSAHHFNEPLVSEDGLIETMFLPPNVTPLIQPMDQHVIQAIKTTYREKLHMEITYGSKDMAQNLKLINLKDVAFWLHESWENVSPAVIKHSWENIGVIVGSVLMNEDDVPLATLMNRKKETAIVSPELQMEFHDEDMCTDAYTDSDIIDIVTGAIDEGDDEDSIEEVDQTGADEEVAPEPSERHEGNSTRSQMMVQNMTNVIEWAEENRLDLSDILHLRKIRSIALEKCSNVF